MRKFDTLPGLMAVTLLSGFATAALPPTLPPTLSLAPESFRTDIGRPLRVRLVDASADAPPLTAWPVERVADLCIRGEMIQTNLESVSATEGAVTLSLPPGNVTLLALELKPVDLVLQAAEFSRLAREQAMNAPGADALPSEAAVRVRRYESLKSLVRVHEPLRPAAASAIATSKVGHNAEIRVLADPTLLRPGSDLPVRAYADGGALKNGKVRAMHVASKSISEVALDPSGIGNLRLSAAGVWRLELQLLKPANGEAGVDWTWFTATVTFEILAGSAE